MEPPRILSAASFQRLIVHSSTQICLEQRSVGLSIMFNIAQIFAAVGIILVSAGMARTMSAPNRIRPDCRCPRCFNHENERNGMLPRTVRKTKPRDL
jgi:hypothetical protein